MAHALFLLISRLILWIVYGKEEAKTKNFPIQLLALVSLGASFWLISMLLLLAGSTAKDFGLCIAIGIIYPAGIAIWSIVVRKKKKNGTADSAADTTATNGLNEKQ